jgi:pimeloyl-ACP methyl ester carboxylesterase
MNREAQTIRLSDGRLLGNAEYGNPKGKPLFFFHGWPSSRLAAGKCHELAKKLNVRIIAPDRPGYGLSDFKKNRTILDWPRDVTALADHLGLKKFAIEGVSGGGPYAAVCGYAIPNRITKLGIVVGLAPLFDWKSLEGMMWQARIGWVNFGKRPWIRKVSVLLQFFSIRTGFALGVRRMFGAESDRKLLHDQKIYDSVKQNYKEAFLQGYGGPELDLKLYTNDWRFDVGEMRTKTYLWYGAEDQNVSPPMGRYYGNRIRGSKLTVYSGEGHFVSVTHAAEILKTLAS